MATLLELATDLVASHASTTKMSKEELLKELQDVHAALSALEKGESVQAGEEKQPAISMRKAFGKKQVTCLVCGKEMKTLGRHIQYAHGLSKKEYREQFGIPASQKLAAKDYSETRRQMAIDLDLASGLAKAREARGKGRDVEAAPEEEPKPKVIRRRAAKEVKQ